MRKDRLTLLLILGLFALMGAKCHVPWDRESPEVRLPDRAGPATDTLRTYFDTATTPARMSALRIPEGTRFDEDQLTLNFPMAGGQTVFDVRARVRIVPPRSGNGADVEMQARVIAPNGVRSAWKHVDWATADLIDPQAEIIFLNDFNGVPSSGTWRLQLRDPVEDGDGRCLLRNATLRINYGEPPGLSNSVQQTVNIPVATGNYDLLPEVRGLREPADWGHFGIAATLINEFEFTQAFHVQGFTLSFSILANSGTDPSVNGHFILIAPSGGWVAGRLGSDPPATHNLGGGARLITYTFGASNQGLLGESFFFYGEPAQGTWRLCLFDTGVNYNNMYLWKDAVQTVLVPDPENPGELIESTEPVLDVPASLTLFGVN
jgi:hypothetical protein